MKENGFKLAKEISRRYPTETITGAIYADDIALLANSPAQDESLLHSLERAADGIGLHVTADKTEYMCFNQRGNISTLKGGPLKLVDNFTYLGSSVSSTENDINTQLAKILTAIDRLSVIWKSDLTNKIKRIFPSSSHVSTAIWMHYMDANKTYVEKSWQKLQKNAAICIKQILGATPYETADVRPPTTHHENYPN